MLQKSSAKIRMPNPKLINRNSSAWNQKDPKNKLKESNLKSDGRLGSSLTINDIPITRHHGNACSISFFSNIETLSCFIYIIQRIYNLTILVQIYMKYIEIYWFQPDPKHNHSKNLAPKRKNKSNSSVIKQSFYHFFVQIPLANQECTSKRKLGISNKISAICSPQRHCIQSLCSNSCP